MSMKPQSDYDSFRAFYRFFFKKSYPRISFCTFLGSFASTNE